MSSTCPSGHPSETADYCDRCGARIGAPPVVAPSPAPQGGDSFDAGDFPPPDGLPVEAGDRGGFPPSSCPPAQPCPSCGLPQVAGARFCENCGYDMVSGKPAEAQKPMRLSDFGVGTCDPSVPGGESSLSGAHIKQLESSVAEPGADESSDPTSPSPLPGEEPDAEDNDDLTSKPGDGQWTVTARADKEYFDKLQIEGVQFPPVSVERTFDLDGEQLTVGRRSVSRGVNPELDFSGEPQDPGISHVHCLLIRQQDNSYSLVDPGSTNGTTVNESDDLVGADPVPLNDGDKIHIGAWTTLIISAPAD